MNATSANASTAVGYQALVGDTTGSLNTAVGYGALAANTTGPLNVAVGETALEAHTAGGANVAVGPGAMSLGTTGNYNTAIGSEAMAFSGGTDNVAVGDGALNMAEGNENIGIGQQAGLNASGNNNIAIGEFVGQKVTTGANNILLGQNSGLNITTGSNNIQIASQGAKNDSGVIRIGTSGTQTKTFITGISGVTVSGGAAVMVTSKSQLGVATSSARYKENIQPMARSSEAILSLQPVTFRYKKELDPEAIPQFGLVAEQVAKVDPDLVARDDEGKPFTVRYEAVNAMLLNEFLKAHARMEEQDSTINELKSALAQQRKDSKTVRAPLERQAAELAQVKAQMEDKVSSEHIGPADH